MIIDIEESQIFISGSQVLFDEIQKNILEIFAKVIVFVMKFNLGPQ